MRRVELEAMVESILQGDIDVDEATDFLVDRLISEEGAEPPVNPFAGMNTEQILTAVKNGTMAENLFVEILQSFDLKDRIKNLTPEEADKLQKFRDSGDYRNFLQDLYSGYVKVSGANTLAKRVENTIKIVRAAESSDTSTPATVGIPEGIARKWKIDIGEAEHSIKERLRAVDAAKEKLDGTQGPVPNGLFERLLAGLSLETSDPKSPGMYRDTKNVLSRLSDAAAMAVHEATKAIRGTKWPTGGAIKRAVERLGIEPFYLDQDMAFVLESHNNIAAENAIKKAEAEKKENEKVAPKETPKADKPAESEAAKAAAEVSTTTTTSTGGEAVVDDKFYAKFNKMVQDWWNKPGFVRNKMRYLWSSNKMGYVAGAISAVVVGVVIGYGIVWVKNRHLRKIGVLATNRARMLADMEGIIFEPKAVKRAFKTMMRDPYIKSKVKVYLTRGKDMGSQYVAIQNVAEFMSKEIIKHLKRAGAPMGPIVMNAPYPGDPPSARGFVHPPGFAEPFGIPDSGIGGSQVGTEFIGG